MQDPKQIQDGINADIEKAAKNIARELKSMQQIHTRYGLKYDPNMSSSIERVLNLKIQEIMTKNSTIIIDGEDLVKIVETKTTEVVNPTE